MTVDFTDFLKCSFDKLVCVVNFTLCCSGKLLLQHSTLLPCSSILSILRVFIAFRASK